MRSLLCVSLLALSSWQSMPANAAEQKITLYKSPTCGCCALWADHVQEAGFEVEIKNMHDLTLVKQMTGVPENLHACHTAVIDGHAIEGHVPAHAIRAFLESAEAGQGLAVPGMPAGSPGMPSPNPETYDVILFDNGKQSVAGTYTGDAPAAD